MFTRVTEKGLVVSPSQSGFSADHVDTMPLFSMDDACHGV